MRLPVENGVPFPVKNGSSDIESYVVIQSKVENDHVTPSVGYSSIDYQSSKEVNVNGSNMQESHYHRPQVVLKLIVAVFLFTIFVHFIVLLTFLLTLA